MSTDMLATLAGFALTVVWGVIFWLLKDKDAKQQAAIDLLFLKLDLCHQKHDELRLHIAESHYKKVELDTKFDRLESSFRSGLNEVGLKMDRLTNTIKERT